MLDLRRLAKAITFTSIGIAPGMLEFAEMFQEVIDQVRTGALTPLPHQIFPLTAARTAFEHMSQSRHVGKIIIAVRPEADRHDEPGDLRDGLSSAEGVVLFRKALELGQPHLIVGRFAT